MANIMAPGMTFLGPPVRMVRSLKRGSRIGEGKGTTVRRNPPAVPPTPPAMALAETLSRGETVSFPQA